MTNNQLGVNLTQLTDLDNCPVLNSFEITWKATLLMTEVRHAGRTLTYVFQADGRAVLVNQSMTTLLIGLSKRSHVKDWEMRLCAEIFGVKTGVPCVAGNFQLIPTHGKKNPANAWLMAHRISSVTECPQTGLTEVVFDEHLPVLVDAPTKHIRTNQSVARKFGSYQVGVDRQFDILHAANDLVANQFGVPNLDESAWHDERLSIEKFAELRIKYYLQEFHRHLDTHGSAEGDVTAAYRALNKPFEG